MTFIKTFLSGTLISLLLAANVSAQLSNVEGIVPLEGVLINKAPQSQSQATDSVNLTRVGFINTTQLFKITGKTNDKESLDFLNSKLKIFAEKYNIGLILQEAVYANPKAEITATLALYIEGKSFSSDFIFNLPTARPKFVRFINADRIFRESEIAKNAQIKLEKEFKLRESELATFSNKSSAIFIKKREEFQNDLNMRKKEETQNIQNIVNEKIKNLSLELNIDFVIQKAVYISPDLDITSQLISLMR